MDILLQENPASTFTAGAGVTCWLHMTGELSNVSESQNNLTAERDDYTEHFVPTGISMVCFQNFPTFQIATPKQVTLAFNCCVCLFKKYLNITCVTCGFLTSSKPLIMMWAHCTLIRGALPRWNDSLTGGISH